MIQSKRAVLGLLLILAAFSVPMVGSANAAPTQWKQCGTVPDHGSRLNAEALKSPCAPALQIARAFAGSSYLSHCGLDENYHEICHLAGFSCPVKKISGGIVCSKEEARVRIKGVHKQ